MIWTSSRALLATAALLVGTLIPAAAQTPTRLERQMSRVDLGITGAGEFTGTVHGPILPTGAANYNVVTTQSASKTVGANATLRYVARPYVGLEFNYGFARYTEGYTPSPACFPTSSNVCPNPAATIFQAQTTANEYTLGYLLTPPHPLLGLQPFASAGMGSIEFKPTGGGGEGLPKKARAVYYYNVGLQQALFQSHFGIRVGFRQLFFLAPDFGQNYLTLKQHTSTTQPYAGFYLRF